MSRMSSIKADAEATSSYVFQALMMTHAFAMWKIRERGADYKINPTYDMIISALDDSRIYEVVIRESK